MGAKMYVYGYLRASTKEQDANRAKARLKKFIEDRGGRIASWYTENTSVAAGYLFNQYNTTFTLAFSSLSFISAFGFSAFIGLLFGIIPANNAAQLNPVEALSHE